MGAQASGRATALWPRVLAACVLVLLAGALLYAAAIAGANFSRIGV